MFNLSDIDDPPEIQIMIATGYPEDYSLFNEPIWDDEIDTGDEE